MEIGDLIQELRALEGNDNVKRKTLEMVMVSVLLDHEKVESWNRAFPFGPIITDLSRVRELFLRAFPGWCYRVAECSVSDDAWAVPDFNHPEHGAELQKRYPEALRDPVEWFGTDVDLRPAGNPALALCISMLLARKRIMQIEREASLA